MFAFFGEIFGHLLGLHLVRHGCGEDRYAVNLEGDSSSKHLSCPGSWALDPCSSIGRLRSCFLEALHYFRDLRWWLWAGKSGWARPLPRQSRGGFFYEGCFTARGLGSGPVRVDWPAQNMLRRSRSLLSRLCLVVVGGLGLAGPSSISREILLGSIFYGLRVGLWTRARRLRRPFRASKKPFVTFETWRVVVGWLGSGGPGRFLVNLVGEFFVGASFMAWR